MSGSDDVNMENDTSALVITLYINLFVFAILIGLFEINRHVRSIFLRRSTTFMKVRVMLIRFAHRIPIGYG